MYLTISHVLSLCRYRSLCGFLGDDDMFSSDLTDAQLKNRLGHMERFPCQVWFWVIVSNLDLIVYFMAVGMLMWNWASYFRHPFDIIAIPLRLLPSLMCFLESTSGPQKSASSLTSACQALCWSSSGVVQVIFSMMDEYVPDYVDKKALVERWVYIFLAYETFSWISVPHVLYNFESLPTVLSWNLQ